MFLAVSMPLEASEGGFNIFDPSGIGGMLWTWVIFGLALVPMWKMVMGPITRALNSRDDLAAKAIADAEKASADAERARAEVEVKLGEARADASKLLDEARSRGAVRETEIVEAASQEARGLVESARRTIEAEREKAIEAIRGEVVELSLSAAGAVLKRNVGTEDDRRLVAEMVGKSGASSGPGTPTGGQGS